MFCVNKINNILSNSTALFMQTTLNNYYFYIPIYIVHKMVQLILQLVQLISCTPMKAVLLQLDKITNKRTN